MKVKYKAAFIIPLGTNKIMDEDGWVFETSSRLSPTVKEYLIDTLRLKFQESYLGIEAFINESIKMSVFYDSGHQIESIHFQLFEGSEAILSDVCKVDKITDEAELFIP